LFTFLWCFDKLYIFVGGILLEIVKHKFFRCEVQKSATWHCKYWLLSVMIFLTKILLTASLNFSFQASNMQAQSKQANRKMRKQYIYVSAKLCVNSAYDAVSSFWRNQTRKPLRYFKNLITFSFRTHHKGLQLLTR